MKKKTMIIIGILVLILIVVSIVFVYKNKKTFDVSGQYIAELNSGIEIIKKNLNQQNIKYEVKTYKNDQVYSALISAHDEDDNKFYMSYNIDPVTKKSLNNEEVANIFGYSIEDIYSKINDRLTNYYNGQVQEGYMDPYECDFECYKGFSLGIDSIESMYSLCVKNNQLYIYLSFDYNQILYDKEYYDNLIYDPFVIEL